MEPSLIGQTVSHYRVLGRVGGGGMGVVYRAEDTKLRRTVALKFLPSDLTADEDAKSRFMIEAQAASALDHPNICTMFEVDETPDGRVFLVMAYYEGETLKAKIAHGPLKVDEALDYAIQIGQGLAKAHAAGIVHRDIKPANILITSDGLAKIVDFGLAKLVGQTGVTRTGTAVGTVAYMSPEQLRGDEVDQRTDIWALGVVLYEMLTGASPFGGDHVGSVSHGILHVAPVSLSTRRGDIAPSLEHVVLRALEKNSHERYQKTSEVVSDLRRLRRESELQPDAPTSNRAIGAAWIRAPRVWATAAVLLLAIAAAFLFTRRSDQPRAGTLANPIQLTSASGTQDFPTWAPDARTIAFASNEAGNNDIWVRPIGSGQSVNRTADFIGTDTTPNWSPDGQQIAFWSARDGSGYYVMPAIGGKPRRVLPTELPTTGIRMSAPQWSRDSASLACLVFSLGVPHVEIVTMATGESARLALPGEDGAIRMELSWSPDSRFFAYIDAKDVTAQVAKLWVLRRSDGKAAAITDGRSNVLSAAWSADGKALFYVSNRAGSTDLWEQPMSDGVSVGNPTRVTTGIGMLRATFSPDGSKLAYSRGRLISNVWRVPILPDRPATWSDARQLTFDEAAIEFVDLSSDGKRLLVSSDKTGNPDLWTLEADGGDMQQITTDGTPDWRGAFSPDGKNIGFYAYRSGARDIWVMPADGGRARQLTANAGQNYFSGWSPDGRNIVFYSNRTGMHQLWVVPADGGEARRVTNHEANDEHAAWSPDGKWIAFGSTAGGQTALWRVPAEGGTPTRLTTQFGWMPQWSPDSRYVYFTAGLSRRDGNNLFSVDVRDGTERRLTDFTGKRGRLVTTAFATDGTQLYFAWGEPQAHVWVADVVRNTRR